MQPLQGIVAATHTPFHTDYALNLEQIDRQAAHLIATDVKGAFVCGTTGEFTSLTLEERKQIAARWRKVIGGKLKLAVHVGGTCLSECCELARHAEELGADAIAAVGPYYFKPAGLDELIAFCKEIAAAAPKTPFYYYHLPELTGVQMPMIRFLEHAPERIPTLVGIKYSDEDFLDIYRCARFEDGRYGILFGCDESLLGALALGISGVVGSTYNFSAPLYHKMIEAFHNRDMETATKFQDIITKMISTLLGRGGHPYNKSMMQVVGVDCGPSRPPFRKVTEAEIDDLKRVMQSIGFYEHVIVKNSP